MCVGACVAAAASLPRSAAAVVLLWRRIAVAAAATAAMKGARRCGCLVSLCIGGFREQLPLARSVLVSQCPTAAVMATNLPCSIAQNIDEHNIMSHSRRQKFIAAVQKIRTTTLHLYDELDSIRKLLIALGGANLGQSIGVHHLFDRLLDGWVSS